MSIVARTIVVCRWQMSLSDSDLANRDVKRWQERGSGRAKREKHSGGSKRRVDSHKADAGSWRRGESLPTSATNQKGAQGNIMSNAVQTYDLERQQTKV